uniref:Helicase n=1 Tax=viral metagenome TaxID=1070528 RepID=A0A6C0K4G6_9ZZZZ
MTTTQLPQLWVEFAYKAHQVEGVKWLFEQEKKTPSGGIVCDEMGLGKTIQMLALLKMESNTSTLLIAPLAVLSQWEDTAKRCGISTLRPKITKLHREWKSDGKFRPLAPKLYIIGYEMARNSPQFLTMVEWTRIICDEAHRLASKTSALSSMVSTIRAQSKWFLTATPIVNSTKDIVNLLTLIGVNVSKNPAELLPIVHEYVMARSMVSLRNIAGVSAPPRPEIHREVLPFTSDEEAEFYKGMTGIIVKHWKALDDEVGGSNALLKLRLFMRLRQLSVHPQVYIHARRASNPTQERPDWSGSSTKFDAILRLLKEPRSEKPHKWIIFCHFHAEMELLKKILEDSMLVGRVFLYNGTLGDSERKLVIAATHESSTTTDVLLIQLQSGGVGLNLQHFDRIIFTGPWWTSALMEQAVGRAVRIGQAEVVHVYHLVLKEEEALNIDQYMMNKAEQKGSLCREILSSAWAGPRDLEAKKN